MDGRPGTGPAHADAVDAPPTSLLSFRGSDEFIEVLRNACADLFEHLLIIERLFCS